MFVIAHHLIQDPDSFWPSPSLVMGAIPANMKLHSVFPSKDLKTGTYIWEASNASAVQDLVDGLLGKMSKNVCYKVNAEVAIGLLQKQLAAAALEN